MPAFRKLRQKNLEFEASLGYIVSLRTGWKTLSQKTKKVQSSFILHFF
jgi:hypothetical protein